MLFQILYTSLLPCLLLFIQCAVASPLVDVTGTFGTLDKRIDTFSYRSVENTNTLRKRQCVLSTTEKNNNGNFKWICDGEVVTKDQINEKMTGKKGATLFYTNLNRSQGLKNAKQILECRHIEYRAYDTFLDNKWSGAVANYFNSKKNKFPADRTTDRFQKCQSQVLAETADGIVYLFTRKDQDPAPGSTWVGWEYPALQRNDKVQIIYKVDPGDVAADTDLKTVSTVLWDRSKDGINTPEPKCTD